jgi:hypothetical protein
MKDLPDWTNNRLLVGFVTAFFSSVALAVQGEVKFYIPVVLGGLFAVTIGALVARHAIFARVQGILARLGVERASGVGPRTAAAWRVIRRAFMLSTVILLGCGSVVMLFQYTNVYDTRNLSGVFDTAATSVAVTHRELVAIAPTLTYCVLALGKVIAGSISGGYSEEGSSYGRAGELAYAGEELSRASILLLVMGFILYIASGTRPTEVSPVGVLITQGALNLVSLVVSSLLVRRYRKEQIGKARRFMFIALAGTSVSVGFVIVYGTTQALLMLFGSS